MEKLNEDLGVERDLVKVVTNSGRVCYLSPVLSDAARRGNKIWRQEVGLDDTDDSEEVAGIKNKQAEGGISILELVKNSEPA